MKKTFGGIAAIRKKVSLRGMKDNRGNVAIIVALSLPVLVLAIGGGADYARILAARSKLQAALDSATLATYRHYMQNRTRGADELRPYFDKTLKASLEQRFERQISIVREDLNLDVKNSTLRAQVTANFPTTFLRLINIDPMKIRTSSEVKTGMSQTEVALVLDVTKSMEGAKLDELKRAARTFLDTVHRKVSSSPPESFKVAIVPFAEYVNVGMDKRNASWIRVDDDVTVTGEYEDCEYVCDHPQTRPACHWEGNEDVGMTEVCEGTEKYCPPDDPSTREECRMLSDTFYVRWQGCVGSRDYPYNMQDDAYDSVKVPGVMTHPRNPDHPADSYEGWHAWPDNNCPAQPITPLTPLATNLDNLKEKIEALQVNGFTYIPIGLAWGWRVLSNNGPDDPFTEGADNDTVQAKSVRKVIILMTDGKNRIAPNYNRDGWSYRDHSWRCDGDESSCDASEFADARLTELCNNIKAINPETGRPNADIITVTFDVSDDHIKNLLKSCSTMGSFDAQSGQLTAVFENIANSLAELHISR